LFYDGSRPDCMIEANRASPSALADVAVCMADTWAAARIDVFRRFDPRGNFRQVADLPAEVPSWGRDFMIDAETQGDRTISCAVYAAGWPRRAITGRLYIDLDVIPYALRGEWVVILPPPKPMRNDQSRLLPLQPLWPGFAINTLFYAVVLWMLVAGPRALNRKRRRMRGLCVKCAYDLRGTSSGVCPECGAAQARRPARPLGGATVHVQPTR